jgi:serine/threonine protein kinase
MYVVTAWRERDVMAQLKSPFLVNLQYAFQDKSSLFLIMPFMQGGDLRYYLNTKGRMTGA